jgi:hypothetical protein
MCGLGITPPHMLHIRLSLIPVRSLLPRPLVILHLSVASDIHCLSRSDSNQYLQPSSPFVSDRQLLIVGRHRYWFYSIALFTPTLWCLTHVLFVAILQSEYRLGQHSALLSRFPWRHQPWQRYYREIFQPPESAFNVPNTTTCGRRGRPPYAH